MSEREIQGLIVLIGLLSQLGGALLIVALFWLLRGHAERRAYFRLWGYAWVALLVALTALAVRYTLLPTLSTGLPDSDRLDVRILYFVYQAAKLTFYGLLAAGTSAYASGVRARSFLAYTLPAAALYAALAVALSSGLNEIVVWQTPVAVMALSFSAAALLRLSPSRRTEGSRATGLCFATLAAMWAVYAAAFGGFVASGVAFEAHPLMTIVRYNAYLDLLFQMLLGYGMVVILMEDAKREVDDAHAELEVAHRQLRLASLYDSLTGSLNRRAFAQNVGLETARATFGAVVMLDLDNLKDVNDGYGHAAGDRLLRRLVEVLRAGTRPSDRLYRWGGDEFLMVLPSARAAEVLPRLDRILAEANGASPAGSCEPELLVSVGAADYEGGEELEDAIDRADRAMYVEKHRRKPPVERPAGPVEPATLSA